MKRVFVLTLFLLFVWGLKAQIIDPRRVGKKNAAENRINRQIDKASTKEWMVEEGIENAIKKIKRLSGKKRKVPINQKRKVGVEMMGITK